MILLALLAIALILSLLFGGRIERLAGVHFHHTYLILLALGTQILIFSTWWQGSPMLSPLTNAFYLVSNLLLVLAVWLNRRVPGMVVLGLGLLSNAAAIFANGGHMPATLSALQTSGLAASREAFDALHASNSSLAGPGTPLWFLGDVLAIPGTLPLANVFSVGDILIGVGGVWFLVANMRPGAPALDIALAE